MIHAFLGLAIGDFVSFFVVVVVVYKTCGIYRAKTQTTNIKSLLISSVKGMNQASQTY